MRGRLDIFVKKSWFLVELPEKLLHAGGSPGKHGLAQAALLQLRPEKENIL